MKKIIFIALTIVILGGIAFYGLQVSGLITEDSAVVEAAETETATNVPVNIIVEARVVPAQEAELSLATSGIVAEVLVAEGDSIAAGQPLLRLHSQRQEAAIARAQAQLDRAQAQLAELEAGALDLEITQAEALLAAAQARYDRITNGPLTEDIEAATAAVAEAEAALAKVREGASDDALIAAELELANALARQKQAQAAYDRVAGNPNIGARPESVELEQATNAVTAAKARLSDLRSGASAADVAAARARLQGARAQQQALQAINPAELAAAAAEVDQAQAQLNLLLAGTRAERIAAAKADIAAAEAALREAEVALQDTELQAPFAGTVAQFDISVGEQVAAGSPVMIMADFDHWQVETEDLTEFDAISLRPGMPVTVSFDALPDLTQSGTIAFVRPIGEDRRGDIIYTAVIDLDEADARLLWNLTAVVEIDPS